MTPSGLPLSARNDAATGGNAIANVHGDVPLGTEEHIHARSEFNQADAFAGLDGVAPLFPADDAPRDQTGNLREDHARAVTFHRKDILLVLGAGAFLAGHQELPFVVLDVHDFAGDRRAIHVYVEDI